MVIPLETEIKSYLLSKELIFSQRSVNYAAPKAWNYLPSSLKNIQTYSKFKYELINSTLLTNMPSPPSLNKSILFILLFVLCLI